jgi:DNA mismatch repair ATPase MutL
MAGISSLPEEIAISITASNRIADLSQLVEELACNSLDAKATQIDIFVNLELMRIEVSDNGDGFDAQVVQVRNSSSTPSKCSSQLNL